MPRTQADVDFEEQQSKLATFLAGRRYRESDGIDDEYMAHYRRARIMLKAQELLEACEFALATLNSLSSDQFAQGGERIARDTLHEAIADANEEGFNSQRWSRECSEAIARSIQINRANTL
jgi:hypothetical protein